MRYHLTPKSSNKKTGPIAVTTSPQCPDSCPFLANGCYAASGPLALHWAKVKNGQRGDTFETHLESLRSLPQGSMIRLNQAGDLPKAIDGKLDVESARELLAAAASNGKIAWTYSHHAPESVREASTGTGVTVNLSGNGPADVDKLKPFGPVATIIPWKNKVGHSPGGIRIVRCPAEYRDDVSCANCGNGRPLCARSDRDYAIGFHPHGTRKAKVLEVVNSYSIIRED